MTQKKPPIELDMSWKGDLRFEARDAQGISQTLDGKNADGLSPMKSLLASLCGCMAIDVVMILKKMRLDLQSMDVSAHGLRNESEPRYFTDIDLKYRFKGDVPQDKAERAVKLSFEKYCSVFHTLRPDIEFTHDIRVES